MATRAKRSKMDPTESHGNKIHTLRNKYFYLSTVILLRKNSIRVIFKFVGLKGKSTEILNTLMIFCKYSKTFYWGQN